jgi:N-acetylglucosaminyldiphosphoundecaprenol N-acetyl-beta-D-mannosaminyltransferase
MFELRMKFGVLRILDAKYAPIIISKDTDERPRTFHFVNAYVLAEANQNQDYFQKLSEGTCFCDSRPLELYSQIIGCSIRQLRGFDFLKENLQNVTLGHQLIIGGTQRREEEVVGLVENSFGKTLDLSFHQPEFTNDISVLHASSVLAINRNLPKTVWIGIGTPKQDYLAGRLRVDLDVNLFCVGAAVAFLVGDIPESPKWIQRAGLEWLYRLCREPERLWRRYLFSNFRFLAILIKDLILRFFSK